MLDTIKLSGKVQNCLPGHIWKYHRDVNRIHASRDKKQIALRLTGSWIHYAVANYNSYTWGIS